MSHNPITINIALSTSNEYSKYAIITMASLLSNIDVSVQTHFHILDSELTEKSKTNFFKIKTDKRYTVDFIRVDFKKFQSCPNTKNIAVQTYYKVMLPSLLPDIDKVLYLDCDIIIADDISELFKLDIGEYYLAAAPDCMGKFFIKRDNMPKGSFVFNGGVLLFNLKKWREDNIEDLVFRLMKLNPKYIGLLSHYDQSLLGKLLGDKTLKIDMKWNLQYLKMFYFESYFFSERKELRRASKNPAIIHYVSWFKPWIQGKNMFSPYWREYIKYLRLTPFAFATIEDEQEWIDTCLKKYRALRRYMTLQIIFKRPYVILKLGFWQNILSRIIP